MTTNSICPDSCASPNRDSFLRPPKSRFHVEGDNWGANERVAARGSAIRAPPEGGVGGWYGAEQKGVATCRVSAVPDPAVLSRQQTSTGTSAAGCVV